LFAVVETGRAPRHQARSMEHGHATSLGEMEEHHEHDLPYIQMVRSDSARVHDGNSTQLRMVLLAPLTSRRRSTAHAHGELLLC
jgi:hypothetical protein